MKVIYLNKASQGDGVLFALWNLKNDTNQTINAEHPNLLSKVETLVVEANYELALKIYGMSIIITYDFCDGYLYGRILITAQTTKDFDFIVNHVLERLTNLFKALGYQITADIPD